MENDPVAVFIEVKQISLVDWVIETLGQTMESPGDIKSCRSKTFCERCWWWSCVVRLGVQQWCWNGPVSGWAHKTQHFQCSQLLCYVHFMAQKISGYQLPATGQNKQVIILNSIDFLLKTKIALDCCATPRANIITLNILITSNFCAVLQA